MPFSFPLDTLLRFRRSLEQQQELLLQQANQNAAAVERRIEEADRSMAEMAMYEMDDLKNGTRAAELHFHVLCRAQFATWRKQLLEELARCQEQCAQRRETLQHARQEREAVETLRQHQMETYRLEEKRKDQRVLDDLFLLRREFLRRG